LKPNRKERSLRNQECRKPGRRKQSGKHGRDAEVEEKRRKPRIRIE
jgi:hypothetical protein